MTARGLKPKTCKICREEYMPRGAMQQVCSYDCVVELNRAKQRAAAEKEAKRDRARRKEALKTVSDWKKECQKAFNAYIRARDYGKVCISCNRHISDIEALRGHNVDCGHYRSVGAASHLRFNTYNAHSQCVQCNRDYSGNVVDYRINLIRRIGQDKVDRLESDNEPRKFSIDYLRRLKRLMNRRARHYKKLRGIA